MGFRSVGLIEVAGFSKYNATNDATGFSKYSHTFRDDHLEQFSKHGMETKPSPRTVF